VLQFKHLDDGRALKPVWPADCIIADRAEEAKFFKGNRHTMANAPKPVKKSKKLGSAKKLLKNTTLRKFDVLTRRLPVS
jgi:hypothetical protein